MLVSLNYPQKVELAPHTYCQHSTHFELPQPIRHTHYQGVCFSVYKVKSLYKPMWESFELKKILEQARMSYLSYGEVPLSDEYDKKSEIYLTRAVYFVPGGSRGEEPVEEWLSVRFVPANGNPISSEDLEQYMYRGKTLRIWLQEDKNILDKVVTISRICRIPPAYILNYYHTSFLPPLPEKNSHTALSFALMNDVFFEELKHSERYFDYVTAVCHDVLVQKTLRIFDGNEFFPLSFQPAYQFFGALENEIHLNRSILAYKHPAYFLQLPQLFKLLFELIQTKRIPEVVWENLVSYLRIEELMYMAHKDGYGQILKYIKNLGKIVDWNGVIPGTTLHGIELRNMIDRRVENAPKLYMMESSKWFTDIQNKINKVPVSFIF